MIFVSFFFIDETFSWPSYWAILPVLGTSLILLTNKEECRLTNNVIAQWLGDRSYSLYLWHWPLVVGLYFASLQNEWSWVLSFFALSIFLANLSYRFIETPTRKYLSQAKLLKEIIVIGMVGTVIGIAAVSAKLFVFEGRVPDDVEVASLEAINSDPRRKECLTSMYSLENAPGCHYGKKKTGAILIGDSHSAATITAAAEASKQHDLSIFYRGMDGCSSIFDVKEFFQNGDEYNKGACKKFNQDGIKIINEFESNIPLIIVNRFNAAIIGANEKKYSFKALQLIQSNLQDNVNKLISTACYYQKNRQVFILRPIPEIGVHVPNTLSRKIMFNNDASDIKIPIEKYYERNKIVWKAQDEAARQCGVKILNPLPFLCDDQYCYGSKDGRPLYYDDDHLSEYGNKFLVPMFEEVFKND